MANQALSESDQAQLLERFARAEREGIGQAAQDKLLESSRRLAERYQVDAAAALPPVSSRESESPACGAT
jgi:hypothetical protein